MKLVHLAWRRSAAHRSLLTIIALTVAALTAVLAGLTGFSQLAATEALRSLANASGTQGYFRVHTTIADDAAAQQAAAEAAVDDLGLGSGLSLSTAPYSPPRPLVPSGGTATNLPSDLTVLPVGWIPTTTAAAGSLEPFASPGAPPSGSDRTGPVPAAMAEATAQSLSLAVGDTFAVEGSGGTVRLELVATLDASGPDAAFLDPVPVQGTEAEPTVVVVPPGAIPALGGEPKVQWVFTVDADTVSAAELPGLADGLRRLPQRLTGDGAVNEGGVVPSGELASLLGSAADATQSVRAVLPTALILLVALGAVTVVQFARLLAGTRAGEDRLISARGLTVRQRAGNAALEILPVALAGCAVGWAAAVVPGPLLSSGSESTYLEGMAEFASASWAVPVLCAGFTALVFIGVAVLDALRGFNTGADAARSARVASFGVLVLLAAATTLSLWQFLLYGSPLVETGSGGLSVNPLAAPAPALLLLAGTALALLVTGWLARLVEHRTGSRTTLGVPLAARQVSRRMASYIIPIALVTVTVGTATFTAAYAQTTSRSQDAASQLGNGSDVRVTLPGPLVLGTAEDIPQLQPYTGIEGVTASSLAYRGEARLGSVTAPLLAVDAASLPGLLSDGASMIDTEELAAALAFEPPVPEPALTLTPSATQVRVQFTSVGTLAAATDDDGAAARNAAVTAWLRSETGSLIPVPAGTLVLSGAGDQVHSLSFAIPEGLQPVAIAAIDVELEPSGAAGSYELEITSVSSDGGIGTGQGRFTEDSSLRLAPDAFGAAQAGIQPLDEGVGMRFPEEGSTTGTAQARLLAGAKDASPLPVALTGELLADLDLAVGDPVSIRPGGVEIDGVVAAVAPVLPGTAESLAVLADLQAYSHASLAGSPAPPRPGEVWLAATDRDDAAAAAAGLAGAGAAVSTADNSLISRFLSPATTSLWIGAIGALLVGGTALMASVVTLVRSRQSEVAILRALGMQARDQARGRRWEVLSVGAAAVVLGLLTGLGVAALTVSLLAQAVVVSASEALRAPLALAVVPLVGVLLVQVLILVLAAWFYGERVKRQALTPAAAVDAL